MEMEEEMRNEGKEREQLEGVELVVETWVLILCL